MPMLLPLMSSVSVAQASLAAAGFRAGDALRVSAGTSAETLPRPRRISRNEVLRLAPSLRKLGLRGGLLSWDGQLEDDARFVTCLARTAAAYGAEMRTRARVLSATGTGATLRDELTGRDPRGHGPRCHQRDRGLGRQPRRRRDAQAVARHPPGPALLHPARPGRVADRPGARDDEPLRVRAPPARRHDLRRPDRRGDRRRDPRRAPGRARARSASCSTSSAPHWRSRCGAATCRDLRRAAPTARLRRRDRRPVAQARRAHLAHRRRDRRRRQAHDLPPDGAGRGRHGRTSPTRPVAPAHCRCSARPPATSSRGSRHRSVSYAASAPRRRSCCPTRWRSAG